MTLCCCCCCCCQIVQHIRNELVVIIVVKYMQIYLYSLYINRNQLVEYFVQYGKHTLIVICRQYQLVYAVYMLCIGIDIDIDTYIYTYICLYIYIDVYTTLQGKANNTREVRTEQKHINITIYFCTVSSRWPICQTYTYIHIYIK